MSEQENSDEFIVVTDLAWNNRHIRFADWVEIAFDVSVQSCGTVSFRLAEPVARGQFVLCGPRGAVKAAALRIGETIQ